MPEEVAIPTVPATPIHAIIIPIRDRVILRKKTAPEVSKGGILLPEQHREQPHQGTVVAVGDGRVMPNGLIIPLVVKVGDEVLFGRFAGTEVIVNGEELLMLREDEVIATLRPGTTVEG